MDENLIKQMANSGKKDSMVPRTVRLPASLYEDIVEFADEMGFNFSIVARTLIQLGWDEFQKR